VSPERYARVKEIFREAMRWAPHERAAVVATLAGDDPALRDEVLSLLAHHDDAPLLREPARKDGEAPPPGDPPGAADDAGEAQTLADLVRAERASGATAGWPLERVVRLLDPVARALAIAAGRGVVHGAVRAEHIRLAEVDTEVDREPAAELVGLADEPTAGPRGASTASPIEHGEAASAAPEQLLPALGPIGPWTDVYALALLCVELMRGRPVTEGSAIAALARTRDEAVQPTPRAVGLEVPAAVEAVMAMAMATRPMERYQDAGRFWTALRDSLPMIQPVAPLPSRPPTAPSGSRGPARLRRHLWVLSAAVIVIAAAAAVTLQHCG
jgi:eukaryotic-like serine/threonine-protein kinase